MDEGSLPSVLILGRPGLVYDLAVQAVRARGHELLTIGDESIAPDAILLVEPSPADWDVAATCDAPIIVMLDTVEMNDDAVDALLAGADAVINTSTEPAILGRAIDTVVAGGVLLPRALAEAMLFRLRLLDSGMPPVRLTPREREILESIVAGDAIKQTARRLGITTKTVQNLQSRLFRKLSCRNRAQAVTRANELGLLD